MSLAQRIRPAICALLLLLCLDGWRRSLSPPQPSLTTIAPCIVRSLGVLQLAAAPRVPTRAVCMEYERLRKAIAVLYMLQKKVQQKEAEAAALRDNPGTDVRLADGKVRGGQGRPSCSKQFEEAGSLKGGCCLPLNLEGSSSGELKGRATHCVDSMPPKQPHGALVLAAFVARGLGALYLLSPRCGLLLDSAFAGLCSGCSGPCPRVALPRAQESSGKGHTSPANNCHRICNHNTSEQGRSRRTMIENGLSSDFWCCMCSSPPIKFFVVFVVWVMCMLRTAIVGHRTMQSGCKRSLSFSVHYRLISGVERAIS